jgi:predicted lipid-binding transport protein (Tim44 family)
MQPFLFLRKTWSDWFDRKGVISIAIVALFILHAAPALAGAEAAPNRGGSVLNILLLGCIAYFLVRSFRRRSGGDDKTRPGNWTERNSDDGEDAGQNGPVVGKPVDRHEAARQAWSVLSSEKSDPSAVQSPTVPASTLAEAEFLEGAKLFFSRFQQARDFQDFEILRDFISDEVYSDALAEAQRDPVQARTEIMLLDARLMEMKTEGERTFATVFYDAQLRKGLSGEHPVHIRTVWEFSRDETVEDALWVLEKINKVEQ